jgi:endonuclease/exonuclease/phosphatase (EEP) superfamily protein YafD
VQVQETSDGDTVTKAFVKQCGITGLLHLRASLPGLLLTGGVVVCVATVFGFMGRFSWFLDLFSHFRMQYLVSLSLLGLVLFAIGRRGAAITFLCVACVNLAVVLPLYFGAPTVPPNVGPTQRAMLLNVNTRLGDVDRVREAILEANPDLLVLEEINRSWLDATAWLTNGYPHHVTRTREDNFGIGLFSKFPLENAVITTIGSAGVPSILATVVTDAGNLTVLATHPLPPAGRNYSRWRNEQLEALAETITVLPAPLLLLGDLNTTPWNRHFRQLVKRTSLMDSAKGRGVQPSWPSRTPLLRIPIDHCLHSRDISVTDRTIGPNVSSDHYPLIVDFAVAPENTVDDH